jgi:hypothetical protein
MKILYRISDGGNAKQKPAFVYDKRQMFMHFARVFANHDIYVFADNVSESTYQFLISHYNPEKVMRISLGNAKSFMYTLDFAIANFSENESLYFAEDDYIYTQNAPQIIEEGLSIAEYSSGYDHPDKYINACDGGNPFIENGGELTRVVLTPNRHWKYTNSFCMTFACRLSTIRADYDFFRDGCSDQHPQDFSICCRLRDLRQRRLASCIPAVSTHGETMWLSKLVDWEREFREFLAWESIA